MGASVNNYPRILIDYLEAYASARKDKTEKYTVVADHEKGHFMLVNFGWDYPHYRHSVVFHFEIKNGKVWIHKNNTEELVAHDLTLKGIPPDNIVLGFQPEERRPFTGYASA